MNCAYLVVGPTGAGKSDVAQKIAVEHDAPVVVAYRIQCHLDLPVTSARLDGVPGSHHLVERTVPDGDHPSHQAAHALLRKVEALSQARRPFVASVNGPEAVLRWRAKTGTHPEDLTSVDDAAIAELAELIALVHHEHSLEQHDVFTRLFGWNH